MSEEEDLTMEMQVFALSLKEEGAITHFVENLDPEDVGVVHGNAGVNQFYIAMSTFYDKTGLDPIDPIAFRGWLKDESDIFTMLGGEPGVEFFFGELDKIKNLSKPEAVSSVLKLKADKRRQSTYLTELSTLLEKKDKSEADTTRIKLLTSMIQTIEEGSTKDPFAKLMTGEDFANRADDLWNLPDVLPTPYPDLNKALGYSEGGGVPKGAITVILAQSGQGKALALDTPIPTPNGWTTMGDLEPGDVVYDENGQPCNVKQVSPVYTDHPCFKVLFSDGSEIIADGGHLWNVHPARGGVVRESVTSTITTSDLYYYRNETLDPAVVHAVPRVITPDGEEVGPRYVDRVRVAPVVPVKCISVDSESNLFLAGKDMIPTHNSTFAKCLSNHWADSGHRVLYVNYEETEDHWARILMTQVTGRNAYMGQTMSELEIKHTTELFKDRMREWGDNLMVLQDPETAYFEDLESWLRQMQGSDRVPDAIVIDTIQSMFLKSSSGGARWNQYEEMMVRLEKLGKDLGSAIVLTAQENTNRLKEGRSVIKASDTGGSIAIVQKASVTMHLVGRESVDDTAEEGLIDIQIPKNRITGQSFSHRPPTIRYNDDKKTFEAYGYVSSDEYHDSEFFELPGGATIV